MSVAPARRTVAFNNPIIDSPTSPTAPFDGMLWRNTSNNAVSVYHASPPAGWQVVSDNSAAQALIQGLIDSTIESDAFNNLMVAASALVGTDGAGGLVSPSTTMLLENLAASLNFGVDGLSISNRGGDYATKLTPMQLEFWKGVGDAAIRFAIFGLLQTVTSPTLQVGYPNQSPKLVLGAGVFEFQAATGNITCRKV